MLKIKIWLTILALYEVTAVILLHLPQVCHAMFNIPFCTDSALKYFVWCVAVPLGVMLIAMWIHEVFVARRRRHTVKEWLKGLLWDVANGVGTELENMGRERRMSVVMGDYTVSPSATRVRKKKATQNTRSNTGRRKKQ